MVGIPYLGARNPHCPEYPLIYEILVGIPSSGDSVQWGFRQVGIPGGNPNWVLATFSHSHNFICKIPLRAHTKPLGQARATIGYIVCKRLLRLKKFSTILIISFKRQPQKGAWPKGVVVKYKIGNKASSPFRSIPEIVTISSQKVYLNYCE